MSVVHGIEKQGIGARAGILIALENDAAAKIFACPCHGSQFNYDGTYHAGPAPRGLDHFQFELLDAGEKVLYATTAGEPVDISKYPNAVFMNVNTGGKVTGIAR